MVGVQPMSARRNGRVYECVLLDINTQYDFCDANGAFPVNDTPSFVSALRRMVAWAKRNHAPVVSSMESHRPLELSDSGYPIHCVDGSCGQRKLEFTLFPTRTNVEVDNTPCVPTDLFQHYQQVIFRKRGDDLLGNPKADRLLTQLRVTEYLVFGAGMDGPVKAAALALLARAKKVTIIVDACGYWSKANADLALRQLVAKGAQLSTLAELLSRKLDRRHRYDSTNGNRRVNGRNGRALPSGQPESGRPADGKEAADGSPTSGRSRHRNGPLPGMPMNGRIPGSDETSDPDGR